MVMCEKIRQARRQAGLSQDELAAAADIPIDSLCSYEDGSVNPGIQDQVSLSRILGISFFYLRNNSCTDPLRHICLQEAMFDFYDRFGADALLRYTEAVTREFERGKQV